VPFRWLGVRGRRHIVECGRLGRSTRAPVTATPPPDHQVAIVGAGPLGLAVAAHLRDAGVAPFICGHPMEFWRTQMPRGMFLRSSLRASSIASPRRELSLERWGSETGRATPSPLPLKDFVDYGEWYQRKVAPELDQRNVASVDSANGRFRLRLEDGEELHAAKVVIAAGIGLFGFIPAELRSLPAELVSHACAHSSFSGFAGRRVAVLGAGQSALESAALLHEAGAEVELIFRSEQILWLDPQPAWRLPKMGAPTAVGGPRTSWLVAAPDLYRLLPRVWQPLIAYRCIRPAASAWLHTRTDRVRMTPGHTIVKAEPRGGQLRLTLSAAEHRHVDHLLLGTGYQVDIRRYPFLAPELTGRLELVDGYPVLGPGLESSIAGLHFVGSSAAYSFGPVMRFVTGSWYSAPAVARRVLARRQPALAWAF
jgi:hypothetical protein